jgi:Holliday junction resolvase
MNSCQKGKRGERGFRDKLVEHGFPATRGRQFQGSPDSPDVKCPSLPFHWEVKHVERLDLYGAVERAIIDAGARVPVVAHRRNRSEWLVTLRADDFLNIVRRSDLPIPYEKANHAET